MICHLIENNEHMYHTETTVILYPIQYKFKKPNEKYQPFKHLMKTHVCHIINTDNNISDKHQYHFLLFYILRFAIWSEGGP